MKPWFVKEGEVIKFPKKDDKVVQLPSIAQYDSFFDGVKDLQAKLERGDITKTVYDKLYTDLIHRFAKKESMEPWYLREGVLDDIKKILNYVKLNGTEILKKNWKLVHKTKK